MLSQVTGGRSSVPVGLMELRSDEQEPSEGKVEPCYFSSSPRAARQAFHYGGIASSRQHYTDLPDSLSERYVESRTLPEPDGRVSSQHLKRSLDSGGFICVSAHD